MDRDSCNEFAKQEAGLSRLFLCSKKYLQIQIKLSCQTKDNMIIFNQRSVRQIEEVGAMYQVILAEREKKTAKVATAFLIAETILLLFAIL